MPAMPTTPLAHAMLQEGLRDAELARRVQCDRSMITRVRLGQIMPSLPLAVAIADEMGIDPRDLIVVRP